LITKLNRHKESDLHENENRIYGVVTAIVTNNKDPENMARIKVKFPWMGEAKDKDSNWVRVASMMAGHDRGCYFIPEVEDEVLIMFENGDVNSPFMIGALWNGKDKPTHANDDGKNDHRCMTSRSGHTFTFDDKDGEEVFELMDKSKKRRLTFKTKGKKIEIINEDDDGEMWIYSKGFMVIETDDELFVNVEKDMHIKVDKDLHIEAENINIKSRKATKIDAGTKLDMNSKAPMKIGSKATMDLKASALASFKASGPLKLESSAIASLKGSITKLG